MYGRAKDRFERLNGFIRYENISESMGQGTFQSVTGGRPAKSDFHGVGIVSVNFPNGNACT